MRCIICHKTLSNPNSINKLMGHICEAKFRKLTIEREQLTLWNLSSENSNELTKDNPDKTYWITSTPANPKN